jgi:predicted cupin superfamily sugar epimerase
MEAEDIIRLLKLKKHPLEGGFYAETYRSDQVVAIDGNPEREAIRRCLSTAIYYLLTPDTYSEMHRLNADEIFHFYLGDPVEMLQLFPAGNGQVVRMGHDIEDGYFPQVMVPAKTWQGCRLISGGHFALMGTTMSPGFDFSDYESGDRESLTVKFPLFKVLIEALSRA